MKTTFQLEITSSSRRIFFPEQRIKTKFNLIEILLEACRYILFNEKKKTVKGQYKIIFQNEKMNRLFFVGESKMYSISFPFNIHYDGHEIKINYKNLIDIDSYTISNLLSFIKDPIINSESCLDFIEPIVDFEYNQRINYWSVVKDLLLLEDGYVRYDKDDKGYKEALEKKQEHRHPLYHLDIFYTNQATFKLGFEKSIIDTDLIDTLDRNTDCKYLKKTPNKT